MLWVCLLLSGKVLVCSELLWLVSSVHHPSYACLVTPYSPQIFLVSSLDNRPLPESLISRILNFLNLFYHFMQYPMYWKPLCTNFYQAFPTEVSLSLPCPCQSLKDLPDVSALDIQQGRSCLCYFWLCNRCGWRSSCRVMLTSRWWAWGRRCDNRRGSLRKWVTGGSRQAVGRGTKWWW